MYNTLLGILALSAGLAFTISLIGAKAGEFWQAFFGLLIVFAVPWSLFYVAYKLLL